MKVLYDLFTPNKVISPNTVRLLIGVQVVIFLLIWALSGSPFLPRPGEVLQSFGYLWTQEGLGSELIVSLMLNLEAMAIATVITLILCYSTVMPFFRPIVAFIGKLRFLSMAGLTFFAILVTENGHQLKLVLLVFMVTTFYATSMIDVVAGTPLEMLDLARTLNMGEWRATAEAIVLGRMADALDSLRQNSAMAWLGVAFVETISREGGGVGTLLADQSKHFHLASVAAIQISILGLGILQDWFIGVVRRTLCPYAALSVERR